MTDQPAPTDHLIRAADEVKIRQRLVRVALGHVAGDTRLRVGKLLDVHSRMWLSDQEIILSGRRIAYVGPAGSYPGGVAHEVHEPDLMAVPGFGEVHKHIESSHVTPEWEAALVLPHGNTWTCEASHEFSNVNGPHNLEFWLTARLAGSPQKIFPLPGSAVPPTAYEWGGGHFGYDEQAGFLNESLMVAGLDEVMDWPAVWNPENPSYDRLWGMIEATFEKRGVIEGHAAGIRDMATINAFAAAGLASDHEAWTTEEVLDKLRRGLFMELRPHSLSEMVKGLLEAGLEDWGQFALTTDDRSCSDTLKMGATDHNVRLAISAGLSPEVAIQMVTINPARHMRLTPWVGSLAPGRFADIVLLDDLPSVSIRQVWADGELVAEDGTYLKPIPKIDWPDWATQTVKIDRAMMADDFAIPAKRGRDTMHAALLRPFHWDDDFITMDLPVKDGQVQRDPRRNVTKFAIVDRFSGEGKTSAMFWLGTGPRTSDTALACSMGHDKHNVWAVGSSDAAMAMAVNALRDIQGGWALVREGQLVATVRYEVGGLMTCRPPAELDAEMQALYAEGEKIDWMYEPTVSPRWFPGFPERLAFATLTCAPWRWVLVAPSDRAPDGFVNVATGQTHPVVW
ncbi:adenine deaminase [Jannaschia sp. CCS1]|uniref:Adenine deaminase 2 n=1 Tax=Jannaschia sp. (strain CCS1) TaxID=290400 RepID=ADEC2_JANSC|nr:adenine deaminase C-terminal domain-containing protein [Jannaschia sp. CCS1]Q28MB2.1 RecName: Full=Adenine deaminase 2; Short=Adenase 2; Short=Adenine aminase 2 [Jannaschia sp. CCS1]ABD56150.1 Adenine deaminase [Jannaschia sp. CCS1]